MTTAVVVVVLAVVALAFGTYQVVATRGRDPVAWGLVALAVAVVLASR